MKKQKAKPKELVAAAAVDALLKTFEERLALAETTELKARYEWESARGAVLAWREAVRVVRG